MKTEHGILCLYRNNFTTRAFDPPSSKFIIVQKESEKAALLSIEWAARDEEGKGEKVQPACSGIFPPFFFLCVYACDMI